MNQLSGIAASSFVFEPNISNTWVTIKGVWGGFLTNVWKAGALVVSTPSHAFNVQIGLGSTMTSQDILDGYLRVTLLVALVHPAEFIVITVEQQQAKS